MNKTKLHQYPEPYFTPTCKSIREHDPTDIVIADSRDLMGKFIAFCGGIIAFAAIGVILAWRG